MPNAGSLHVGARARPPWLNHLGAKGSLTIAPADSDVVATVHVRDAARVES